MSAHVLLNLLNEFGESDKMRGSLVRSVIDLFAFRSNPVSKVYQHRPRNGGILEVVWSTGSLRKNSIRKRHFCWEINTRPISATWNRHESNTTQWI